MRGMQVGDRIVELSDEDKGGVWYKTNGPFRHKEELMMALLQLNNPTATELAQKLGISCTQDWPDGNKMIGPT